MSKHPNTEEPKSAVHETPTSNGQDHSPPMWRVSNRTPYRLAVSGSGETTRNQVQRVLPPFGQVKVTEEQYRALALDRWESLGLIKSCRTLKGELDRLPLLAGLVFALLFYAAVIWLVWYLVWKPPASYWLVVFEGIVALSVVFLMWKYGVRGWSSLPGQMAQYAGMFLVIAIAFGFPAYVIVVFGDVSPKGALSQEQTGVQKYEDVPSDPNQQGAEAGSSTSLTTGPTQPSSPPTGAWTSRVAKWMSNISDRLGRLWRPFLPLPETKKVHTLGRLLQLLFIGTFASLPALLFYLFDRQRLSTLRERFFRSVLSLHPCLLSYEDAMSVYGMQADEALGEDPEQPPEAGRTEKVRRAKKLVVIVATLVMTIGWILCLSPVGSAPRNSRADADLLAYFTPAPDPMVFAFLGSYVFAIGLLLRLYVRSDLKPKAYAHICVRIITSIALGWAVSAIPISSKTPAPGMEVGAQRQNSPNSPSANVASAEKSEPSSGTGGAFWLQALSVDGGKGHDPSGAWGDVRWQGYVLLLLAFSIGFFPSLGFAVIREFLRSRKSVQSMIPSLEEPLPLDGLDGINVYHRARLQDEGIDNVENLAHADLVDLVLQTRFPLPTLVDWVDQAILYLHAGRTLYSSPGGSEGTATDPKAGENKDEMDRLTGIDRLRSYGIRTATDLEQAYREFTQAGKEEKRKNEFLSILGPATGEPKRLELVLQVIKDDEWMPHLRYYRDPERFKPHTFTLNEIEKKLGLRHDN